jgi:hypothetical protein
VPDRDAREIERWAREHELPYFDERVHCPDVRIEYELEGRHQHVDIERDMRLSQRHSATCT